MVTILVQLLIVVVVVYVVQLVINQLHLPQPAKQIGFITLALVVLIYLLKLFGVAVPL